MKLKIVSYNIWAGKHYKEVLHFLRQERADVMCLQEVGRNNPYHPELVAVDILEELRKAFPEYAVVYAPIGQRINNGVEQSWGNVILSKHKIRSSKLHYFFQQPDWIQEHDKQARNALETQIEVDGSILTVFTTHLTYAHEFVSSPRQLIETKKLINAVGNKKLTVLAGDINAHLDTEVMRLLQKKFPHSDGLSQPTFAKHPFSYKEFDVTYLKYKIDHILATKDITIERVTIPDLSASDHLPLVAILKFSEKS